MNRLPFKVTKEDGSARTGEFTTQHGKVTTPCFMPVGTRGAVKTLTSKDLESLGYGDKGTEIILGNTYHLMLRPGDELIARQGGLHKFMDWNGSILTDSGGFQILSLEPKITKEGAMFRSTYDGTQVHLTPEKAVQIQNNLGADIQMVLDVCPPLPSEPEIIQQAVEITGLWAHRAREAFLDKPLDNPSSKPLAQFGIIQGGLNIDERQKSASQITALDFEGYGIGGLSVGEKRQERIAVLKATVEALPKTSPRYLMGVGDPISLIEAISCGVDMFDCVLPTRLARHGTALTSQGRLNLKAAKFAEDKSPIDPNLENSETGRWSRSYIRHLFSVGEPAAGRILTLHNLAWTYDLIERARQAIETGSLSNLLMETREVWQESSES